MKKLHLLPLLFALGCGGAADSPPTETNTSNNPTPVGDNVTIVRPPVTDFTTGETFIPPDYGTTTSDGVSGTGGTGTSDGPGTGGSTSDGPGVGGTTSDGPGTGGTTSDGPPDDSSGGTTDGPPETGGSTSDGPGTGGTTSDGVGGTGGTTSDGSGGSGGTTSDGSGGTGGTTDDGVGGTGLTYDAPPPPPPAPPPPPPTTGGTTGDGSGGTGNTDDGSGGTGLTYDAPPPPPPAPPPPPPETGGTGGTDDGSGGTSGTDDNTGGTSGTDDNTGGTGGSYTPPDDCPWVCIPQVYEEVNVIVLNDAWLENCDVEGRLFVGNNATFPSYAVGTRMTPDASRYDLVVGNDLVYNNGSVPNGAVAYGGTLSRTGSAFAYGGWHQDTPVDFDQLNNDMLFWSDSLAAQPANGTTTIQYGGISLVGTSPALNIFEIDAADLANCNGLTINVPAGATALINVSGTNVVMQNFGIFFEGGADKQYTMFNMYEAEDVTFSGIGINGSVLAPRADLDFTSGNIDGQLVVENYVVQGRVSGEGHPYYFQGCPWVCL